MTLTATDDANGSGIKSITYSATGAQPIQSTTVNAASTDVVITANGITTLSYFATDNEGNTSDVGMTTVKLDKVAPEAYLQFDPVKRDIAVFGRDGLSGTPAGPRRRPAFSETERRQEPACGDPHVDLADAAGNTLQLVHSVGLTKNDAVAGIQTLQYNGGAVVRPVYNVMFFDWKLKQNALDELHRSSSSSRRCSGRPPTGAPRTTGRWSGASRAATRRSRASSSSGSRPRTARSRSRPRRRKTNRRARSRGGPSSFVRSHRRAVAVREVGGHRGVAVVHCPASGSVSWNNIARTSQVSSPKTIAPLAPKIVNCSLTFLEITYDVTSERNTLCPGRWVRYRPPKRARDPVSREHQRLQHANTDPRDGTHEDDVPSAYPVIDERSAGGQARGESERRRRDPEPRDPPPEGEPLCCTDNHARDETPDERRPNGIDSIHG